MIIFYYSTFIYIYYKSKLKLYRIIFYSIFKKKKQRWIYILNFIKSQTQEKLENYIENIVDTRKIETCKVVYKNKERYLLNQKSIELILKLHFEIFEKNNYKKDHFIIKYGIHLAINEFLPVHKTALYNLGKEFHNEYHKITQDLLIDKT